ncbi:hypothetical protein GCM10022205_30260 [Spinactinospora alkalitolerans]
MRTSRELGPDYDDAVAASLAERLDHVIDARVREHLAARAQSAPPAPQRPDKGMSGNTLRLVMGILSLAFAVPISAIGGSYAGGVGMVLAWIGILVFYCMVVIGSRR